MRNAHYQSRSLGTDLLGGKGERVVDEAAWE